MIVVHGPRGTGRASAAHDIAVAALASIGSIASWGHESPDHAARGRVRLTAVVCDMDDAWALPLRGEDVFDHQRQPRDRGDGDHEHQNLDGIASSVITPLFHERRAKYSACHLLVYIDLLLVKTQSPQQSQSGGNANPFCRFLVVDLAPTPPIERGGDHGGDDDDAGRNAAAALLSLVYWQRAAFLARCQSPPQNLRTAAATPPASSPSRGRVHLDSPRAPTIDLFESSSPVVNLMHAFAEERHMTQAVFVALTSPLHSAESSWRTISVAARLKQAASRRGAVTSMDYVEDLHGAAPLCSTESTTPQQLQSRRQYAESPHPFAAAASGDLGDPKQFHAFDADVTGVLQWDSMIS
jgi:hypothetical protein